MEGAGARMRFTTDKEADSRCKLKHNGRSDHLFLERMIKVVEQE